MVSLNDDTRGEHARKLWVITRERARVSTGIEIMVRFRNDHEWYKSFTRIKFTNVHNIFKHFFG